MSRKAKVLYLDIENSQMIVEFPTYSLYDIKKIDTKYIKHDWYITCAAWAVLDVEKQKVGKIGIVAVNDFKTYKKNFRDDYGVVKKLHEVLSDVDIIVGHNSDSFDLKKINYKFIKYGFKPVSIPFTVDTLKSSRRYFKPTSHSLYYLAKELGVSMKVDLPPGTMHKADKGCEKSLEKLKHYNKGDIKAGAAVYFKLLPFITNHPNMNAIKEVKKGTMVCTNCGSKDYIKHGFVRSKTSKFQKYSCNNCNCYFRDKKSLASYEGR